jgi:hypothetical protein
MKKNVFIFVMMGVLILMVSGCAPGTVAKIDSPASNTQAGTPVPNGEINVPGVSIQVNAPGPNPLSSTAGANGHVAGILMGLWHGFISPVTLIISFVNKGVQMYEVHNDGSQYNLGFLVGIAVVFILLGVVAGSRR